MFQRLGVVLLVACSVTNIISAKTIGIVGDKFMLDGKPLQIISGAVQYFKIPAAYWRDRLYKAKAAGLNAISTYVEWRSHEPEERQYRFEGEQDVAAFVRTAAEVGLLVLLRLGPYINAERDMGGFPYWLLSKYPKIHLRTTDKDFVNETEIWIKKLFEQLSTLLCENGGPIILVQVENEYSNFGSDKNYKEQLRDIIKQHVGTKALLYTTDTPGLDAIKGGFVSGALSTVDFGIGWDVEDIFKHLREFMPNGPLMNSEFYTGWLTHWGDSQAVVSTDAIVSHLDHMIKHDQNVNIYVFCGGTNFEFNSGANTDTGSYASFIPSYDFDAPVSEDGNLTQKYWAIRNLMIKYHPEVKNITPPAPTKKGNYGKVRVGNGLMLLSAEGRSKLGKYYGTFESGKLPTFEHLRQRAGLMLYEITLDKDYTEGILNIPDPRDRVYVFVDDQYRGLIDRESKKYNLSLKGIRSKSRLSLLCENQGHISYGTLEDVKGIREVKFNNTILPDKWNITGYTLQNLTKITGSNGSRSETEQGPVLYEGSLLLPKGQKPLDTFVDTSGWEKGYVWVNGRNLGRYWPRRGPQVTLYLPGAWLRAAPAHNTVQLLELESPAHHLTVDFINYPILNNHTKFETNYGTWHE